MKRGIKYLDTIKSGTERMQVLIDDLLTYSRVTTKSKEFESVHLNSIADEVIDILELPIKENNAQINYGKLPVVSVDFRQMKQLFQNLISNSLKFRNAKDPVVDITAQDEGDHWLIKIEDNGIGFDMQYAEQIFVAFKKLHNRAEYSGSGIGLSICSKIVERHGGKIWAESEPGKGARFFFTLQK